MSDAVLIDRHAGWVRLTLNRPDKLNSFNEEMHHALRAGLEAARDDADVRAILLTGAGRGFCAGQDLGDRNPDAGPPDLGSTLERLYNPLIRLIRSIPKPVVCAVNGVAAGAGANVALACDIVLAAKSARFIEAFAKLGLIPDAGGTWTLARLVGEARAKAMILTGEPVGAEQAAAWGLIWRAVDDDKLTEHAEALMARFAEAPTFGLGLSKMLVQEAATNSLDAQLDRERDTQRRAGQSADFAEGVRAFLEKRAPRFTGRES